MPLVLRFLLTVTCHLHASFQAASPKQRRVLCSDTANGDLGKVPSRRGSPHATSTWRCSTSAPCHHFHVRPRGSEQHPEPKTSKGTTPDRNGRPPLIAVGPRMRGAGAASLGNPITTSAPAPPAASRPIRRLRRRYRLWCVPDRHQARRMPNLHRRPALHHRHIPVRTDRWRLYLHERSEPPTRQPLRARRAAE